MRAHLMTQPSRTFGIFVSSTFSDLKAERNVGLDFGTRSHR